MILVRMVFEGNFRSLETTIKLSDSLEGLTELSRAVLLMVAVYYRESLEIKVSEVTPFNLASLPVV